MLKETIWLALFIIIANPIKWINENYSASLGADFSLCFVHKTYCSIDSFAILLGFSLPLALLFFAAIYFLSDKTDKLKAFAVLLVSFSIAHAIGANLHTTDADPKSIKFSQEQLRTAKLISGDSIVSRVIDGDTIEVVFPDGNREAFHIAGIDSPDINHPHGLEAKDALIELCPSGTSAYIDLVKPNDWRDINNRMFANLICKNNIVADNLVDYGHAIVYEKYAENHKHLYAIQEAARNDKVGLWAE